MAVVFASAALKSARALAEHGCRALALPTEAQDYWSPHDAERTCLLRNHAFYEAMRGDELKHYPGAVTEAE